MRLCILLPRHLPQLPASPVTRVVNQFPTVYRTGLATAAAACARGHDVQCVLVGPDAPEGTMPLSSTNNNTSDIFGTLPIDPALELLANAFPAQLSISCATPPDAGTTTTSFIDARSDLSGITHWAQTINSAVTPGAHCVIDAVGAECSGACKYMLTDTAFSVAKINGVDCFWDRNSFPDSACVVKGMCQVFASNKLVHALSSAEATMQRAPESSVIPPSTRDASKKHMPRMLQQANPTAVASEVAEEDAAANENARLSSSGNSLDDEVDKDFPPSTLMVSLTSWRLLKIAEWQVRRVLTLPGYDGGEESEVCIAAAEDLYKYFSEMFKQKTFTDFSFLGVPPLVGPTLVDELLSARKRRPTADATDNHDDVLLLKGQAQSIIFGYLPQRLMTLHPETLPFEVWRPFAAIPSFKMQSRILGMAAARSDIPGYAFPVCADDLGVAISEEIARYIEADADQRRTYFNYRYHEEFRREEEKKKQGGGLQLASRLRFSFGTLDMSRGGDGSSSSSAGVVPMTKWFSHAKQMERKYSEMRF